MILLGLIFSLLFRLKWENPTAAVPSEWWSSPENPPGDIWTSHYITFVQIIWFGFFLFSMYVLSTFRLLLLSWKPKLAPANYRADTNQQGGTWRGMLGLIKECKPGLVIGLCDCASTPLPSEIPDIYWSIFIQSVRSLMLSMCYLAALQRRRTCFQMFHGESSSPVKAVPSRLSRLPLIRDNITCFGLCTPPWQFRKRKKKHSPLEAKDRFITRIGLK